jgi:hypothetical protein
MIDCAVLPLPVNENLVDPCVRHEGGTASGPPFITFRTPGGTPASWQMRAKTPTANGASSGVLSATAFPDAKAAASLRAVAVSGPFQLMMARMTAVRLGQRVVHAPTGIHGQHGAVDLVRPAGVVLEVVSAVVRRSQRRGAGRAAGERPEDTEPLTLRADARGDAQEQPAPLVHRLHDHAPAVVQRPPTSRRSLSLRTRGVVSAEFRSGPSPSAGRHRRRAVGPGTPGGDSLASCPSYGCRYQVSEHLTHLAQSDHRPHHLVARDHRQLDTGVSRSASRPGGGRHSRTPSRRRSSPAAHRAPAREPAAREPPEEPRSR